MTNENSLLCIHKRVINFIVMARRSRKLPFIRSESIVLQAPSDASSSQTRKKEIIVVI